MKILECEQNGIKGWKCGENGKCYIGIDAKQRAFREEKEIKSEYFSKNPAPLPKNKKDKKSKKK